MKLAHLSGKTIAIMVASGFDETGFIAIQRAMMDAGAKLKIISGAHAGKVRNNHFAMAVTKTLE